MPIKKTTAKIVRKPIVSKASLLAKVKDMEGQANWATTIIKTQQGEIDRLSKLNEKLTDTVNNLARHRYAD